MEWFKGLRSARCVINPWFIILLINPNCNHREVISPHVSSNSLRQWEVQNDQEGNQDEALSSLFSSSSSATYHFMPLLFPSIFWDIKSDEAELSRNARTNLLSSYVAWLLTSRETQHLRLYASETEQCAFFFSTTQCTQCLFKFTYLLGLYSWNENFSVSGKVILHFAIASTRRFAGLS